MLIKARYLGYLYFEDEPGHHARVCAGTAVSGDKLKIQTYCEIAGLSVQLAQASRKQNTKKVEKLAQNIDDLESKLGPEYPALLDGLWNIDPTSQDAREIGSTLDKLDESCGN
jgi:hypothetical protein